MLGSCCLLGHVDFAFSYVFLGTHVSSRRSASEITKYCSHSTYTRTYTLGLCVQSSRDALHKQTFAAIANLQESQGAFAAQCSKALQPHRPLVLLGSAWLRLLQPPSLRDQAQHNPGGHPSPGWTEEQSGVFQPFPATQLACNSAFPHRGASKRMDDFALLLPSPPKHLSC